MRARGLLEKGNSTLSVPPGGGGQVKQLIDAVKISVFKVISGARLTWDELCDVI